MVPLVDVFKFNLILKQCERDNKAFETLFDFYYPRIKLHIHKKFPDACADDVAQEFFLQLMKSHGFKYVQNPTAWVFACCDNIAKRMLIGESATLPLLVSENYSVSEDLVETEILNDQAKTRFRRFGRRLHEKDILLVLLGRLQSARNRATSFTQYKHDKTASRKGHKENKKLTLKCNQIAKTVTLIM